MTIPQAIIFIGPQGSGKGTQSKLLADKIDAEYIGTGNVFRDISKQDSDFGRHIKSVLDQGLLVSDEDVEKVIKEKLAQVDTQRTLIFDGIPRRLSQAQFLLEQLNSTGRQSIATVAINLSPEEATKRMKLRGRADDTDQAISQRLDLYNAESKPVIDYLKAQTDFYEVDGAKTIPEIETDIVDIFGV